MFSTLRFDWEADLAMLQKEISKLAGKKESEKDIYAEKISNNISKAWTALYKEIIYAKSIMERDQATDQEIGHFLAHPMNKALQEEYQKAKQDSQNEYAALMDVQRRLVVLKKGWEKVTGKEFKVNPAHKTFHVGSLEGHFLFKDFKRLNKLDKSDPQRFVPLIEKMQAKKQAWQDQLQTLKIAIESNTISRDFATQVGFTLKQQSLDKDITSLKAKLQQTEEFLRLVDGLNNSIEAETASSTLRQGKG